eukprot:374291-Prorocentrum_minimum.AAC.1
MKHIKHAYQTYPGSGDDAGSGTQTAQSSEDNRFSILGGYFYCKSPLGPVPYWGANDQKNHES